jgi:peptidoglycan-N-acetylglucosamine deacetylase
MFPTKNIYTPTVTILIPAHNEESMIAACVESCLNQTHQPDQILVINDGSTDTTHDEIARFGDAVTIVRIPFATGNKSHAQQIGLQFVTSDIVIATDADTVLDKEFVSYIVQAFSEHPDAASVSGYVKSTSYNFLTALREIDYTIGQDVYKRAQAYVNYLLVIPGCAGGFKTELFRNGTISFDHDTLTEDLDFTYKLHQKGLRIFFEPRAIVYTQDPHTLDSYINQMRRWFGGGWQNLRKHYKIAFTSPGAALQLSLNYTEGMLFALMFFLIPLISFTLFLQLLFIHLLIVIFFGAYAAWRRKRWDLLFYSPLMILIRALNAWIFLEQFVLEIILGRKKMVWFHPERRSLTGTSI